MSALVLKKVGLEARRKKTSKNLGLNPGATKKGQISHGEEKGGLPDFANGSFLSWAGLGGPVENGAISSWEACTCHGGGPGASAHALVFIRGIRARV